MYYEAKSVNTQLLYRYKQLEKIKESLTAEWIEHKRLHQAAGHDVSDFDSSPLHTYDVLSSYDCPSACIQKLSSVFSLQSKQVDEARPLSLLPGCPHGEPSFCAADYDLQCRTSRDRPRDFGSTVASKRPRYIEFSDGLMAKRTFDVAASDRQLKFSPCKSTSSTSSSSPPFYCVDDPAVLEPTSTELDVDQRPAEQPALRSSNDDDDGLELLFGGDDWWLSDESWRWQCGSPAASSVDEMTSPTDNGSVDSQNDCLLTTSIDDLSNLLKLDDAATASGSCRHHETFIPLHVAGLLDDSYSQWQETLDT